MIIHRDVPVWLFAIAPNAPSSAERRDTTAAGSDARTLRARIVAEDARARVVTSNWRARRHVLLFFIFRVAV
jgi:hypothetical protein